MADVHIEDRVTPEDAGRLRARSEPPPDTEDIGSEERLSRSRKVLGLSSLGPAASSPYVCSSWQGILELLRGRWPQLVKRQQKQDVNETKREFCHRVQSAILLAALPSRTTRQTASGKRRRLRLATTGLDCSLEPPQKIAGLC
mmetsp:Transcript_16759/g.32624  ORF Transcript_16759/g.32624 Transcript_16759/m.32624 type:complete len:143 (+) Transcript_16759:1124-1552(+)